MNLVLVEPDSFKGWKHSSVSSWFVEFSLKKAQKRNMKKLLWGYFELNIYRLLSLAFVLN
jgi:hypothetical protein